MRIDILTVVPELLRSPLNESILKRAQEKGLVEIVVHNLHDYAHDKRKTTDDYPFGGEAGMVMKPEPVFELVEKLQTERRYDEIVYTSPDGVRYDQHEANRLSTLENIIVLCGHYKGIDHRIRGRRTGCLRDRRLGGAAAAGRHRRRVVGAHGLLPGQPAGAARLHAAGRIPRLARPRRAAVGQLRRDRGMAGRTVVGAHPTAAPRPAGR